MDWLILMACSWAVIPFVAVLLLNRLADRLPRSKPATIRRTTFRR